MLPVLILGETIAWCFILLKDRHQIRGKLNAYQWIWANRQEIREKRRDVQNQRLRTDREMIANLQWHLDFKQTGDGFFTQIAQVIFNPIFRVLYYLALIVIRW